MIRLCFLCLGTRHVLQEFPESSDGYRFFQSHKGFFVTDFAYRHHRMSCTRRGSEDRTRRRTHIVLGVVCVAHLSPSHTHACGSRFHRSRVLSFCAHQKSSTHIMFHRPLLDVPDPLPSCCFTPPPSASTALPVTGIRGPPCATPRGGLLLGNLAESTPLTCCDTHPAEFLTKVIDLRGGPGRFGKRTI